MELLHIHLAALACMAKLASAGLFSHTFVFYETTDGTGDAHKEVGTSDCAVLGGDKQISSMQATCDSLCGEGENDFCLSTFDNDECSHNSFSNYKSFSFNALKKDDEDKYEVRELTPAKAFMVTSGACGSEIEWLREDYSTK